MTSFQIFALCSPLLLVVLMWAQGEIEKRYSASATGKAGPRLALLRNASSFWSFNNSIELAGSFAFEQAISRNPEIRRELAELATFVERSGDRQSQLVLEKLLQQIGDGENKRATTALWERLAQLQPAIERLAGVFNRLDRFFH